MKTFLIIALIILALNVLPYAIGFLITATWLWTALVVVAIIVVVILGIIFITNLFANGSASSYYESNSSNEDSSSSSSKEEVTETDVVEAIKNILRNKPGNHIAIFYNPLSYFPDWKFVDQWGRTGIVSLEFDGSLGQHYFLTRDNVRYSIEEIADKEKIYYFDVT